MSANEPAERDPFYCRTRRDPTASECDWCERDALFDPVSGRMLCESHTRAALCDTSTDREHDLHCEIERHSALA